MDEAGFMAEVDALAERRPGLTMLHAAMLVALREGIAADTRTFAKVFGVAHALVLRAASDLADEFVAITGRDPRTQRTRLELTAEGHALAAGETQPLAA